MSILTTNSYIQLATAFKNLDLWFAIGRGNSAWETETPRENRDSTSLVSEIGRRRIRTVKFCRIDPNGEIIFSGNRYAVTEEPSRFLYCQGNLDFEDALGETIREIGIFAGARLIADVPSELSFYRPKQVEDKGVLLAIDHREGTRRVVPEKFNFSFVISF